MITRAAMLAAGVTGAVGASQFPEFSQQYMQRLGGAVDELARQIDRYENDALGAEMTLPAYLEAMQAEGPIGTVQATNIQSDIDRHAALSGDLAALEGAGPFSRVRLATHLGDRQIAARAWEAYEPAVPTNFEGAVFAGSGFLVGWGALAAIFTFLSGGLSLLTGRRKRPA